MLDFEVRTLSPELVQDFGPDCVERVRRPPERVIRVEEDRAIRVQVTALGGFEVLQAFVALAVVTPDGAVEQVH